MSEPSTRLTHPLDLLQVIEQPTGHDLQHGGCDRRCENCPCAAGNGEPRSTNEQEGANDAA